MNPNDVQESWSIAYLVGWPLWILLLLTLLVATVWFFGLAATDEHERGFFAVCGVVTGLIGTGLTILFFSPWGQYPTGGDEYHKWIPKHGTVAEVGKRLLPSGESMEEKIVVTFKGDPQEYGVEDTRAALLKPGDEAIIKCKRSYQWGSVHGYDCRFVLRVPAGGAK